MFGELEQQHYDAEDGWLVFMCLGAPTTHSDTVSRCFAEGAEIITFVFTLVGKHRTTVLLTSSAALEVWLK